MTAFQGGDIYVTTQAIEAANTAQQQASTKLKAATADITAFNNANGG
jgi:hypothetical protein